MKREIPALAGGTAAWRAAGLPIETGDTRMLEPPAEDVYFKPYDHKSQVEAAGFKFEGESALLRNPADDRKLSVFDKKIQGRTDQFLLKFRKPN